MPDSRRAAGEVHQFGQQLLALAVAEARDAIGVAADGQRLSSGFRMHLHQRPQRRLRHAETVPGIGAALRVRVPQLALAVGQRVVGAEALHLHPQCRVQRIVGRPHVGEAGLAAGAGRHVAGEHSSLGLHRHVGGVLVPAHVALQHLDHVVGGVVGPQRAVRAHVGDRRQVELRRPHTLGEGHLLVRGQVLPRKDQQGVLQPGVVEQPERRLGDLRQPHARHHCPERRGQGLDGEGSQPHGRRLAPQRRLGKRPLQSSTLAIAARAAAIIFSNAPVRISSSRSCRPRCSSTSTRAPCSFLLIAAQ